VAIERCQQRNLLEESLGKIPGAVAVLDPNLCVRYANRPAARLFRVSDGWHPPARAGVLPESVLRQLQGQVEPPARGAACGRRVEYRQGIGGRDAWGAVLSCGITDWFDRNLGVVLHVQDMTYLYRLFEALGTIAEARDTEAVLDAMLELARKLGHRWGRLYMADPKRKGKLLSRRAFGCAPEVEEAFRAGLVPLDAGIADDPVAGLRAGTEKMRILCHYPDRDDGTLVTTASGLQAVNVKFPRWPAAVSHPIGDFWIDFPMANDSGMIGRLILECDPRLMPEDVRLLDVFARGLLRAVLRRTQEPARRERLLRQAAEWAMEGTANALGNRVVAALPALLCQYRDQEAANLALGPINRSFSEIIQSAIETVKWTSARLGQVDPQPREFDLAETVRRVLSDSPLQDRWTVAGDRSFLVWGDPGLLEMVFAELVENSVAAVPETEGLRVRVEWSTDQDSAGNETVRILYQDNGPGVSPEYKQQIFEPFFSHRPGQAGGLGLGLSFIRRILEAHGGGVSEIGDPEKGAQFLICWPRGRSAALRNGG
jgi:hypothetical protein